MTLPTLRLCTCGHRYNRHSELDKEIRGECLLCSCSCFEDVKSSIEEEIAGLTAEHYAEHFPVKLLETTVQAPAEPQLVKAEYWTGARPSEGTETAPKSVSAQVVRWPSADILESFDAWRCAQCGSRSPVRLRCDVLAKCRQRWMEPVTVTVTARRL